MDRSPASRRNATWLDSIACWIAPNNTSSPYGLIKNSTAPAFIARTVMDTSGWPVINMIGISVRTGAMRFCSSRPSRSGSEMSSTRQLGTKTRGRERNSWADPNVCGCQPAKRISDSSDSRTEMSSSTTNTTGVSREMKDDLDSGKDALAEFISCPLAFGHSAHSKCGIEGLKQRRVAERLEQAFHGTLLEQALIDGLIGLSGDEDDRNLLAANRQFLL